MTKFEKFLHFFHGSFNPRMLHTCMRCRATFNTLVAKEKEVMKKEFELHGRYLLPHER